MGTDAPDIRPVRTAEELRAFVDLPFAVYGRDDPWVPNLRRDDLALLTPGRHPFWETARRELFLAYEAGRPVGRIAAIVDEKHNGFARERCGAFGFFECLPRPDAAQALLASASAWLKAEGMDFMRGPLNPSTNYTCGLLVDGFAEPPAIMMPWNPREYAAWFERFHLRKEQDLFAYRILKQTAHMTPQVRAELARLKAEGRFTARASSKKTLAGDVRTMLDIYRESWSQNFGFSPLSPKEAEILVKDLTLFLDPQFFVLFFHAGEPAGGMVAFPDYTPLLKRLNGRLSPLLPWHYFRTRKLFGQGYRIILFGIREAFRLMGLPLLVFDYMLEKAKGAPDFQWVEGSWVLEDNAPVCDLIEDFSGTITKRYRIYRKDLV
ncbi:MAG: hypothetical protein K6E40_16815 [Desulfovibrio sp.]|nr:hypothetical protein [Desulfovibrio sp.]